MAVKKGILDNFLKPSSHSLYSDNQKNLRTIFIDKTEDDYKPDPENFLESSLLSESSQIGTQLEHNKNTIGTQLLTSDPLGTSINIDPVNKVKTQLEHIKNTTGTHQGHKRDTKGTQKGHNKKIRNTIGTQLEHAKGHTLEHNRNTTGTHKEHNWNTNHGLSYLSGIQKQLVNLFYLSCKKSRSHITEEFAIHNIADALKIRLGSVKTSLRRLEEKGFIKSVQFKKGRGGWTQFELPDDIYRELLEREKEHNWNTNGTQMEHKWNTYRNTQKDTNAPSSSSLINTTTTTSDPPVEEWNFDITPYVRFGFTISQIKQLASLGVISAADVEQSLIEFSYDLDHNALPHIKTTKINFLMGLLRTGHSYVSESFKNEQEAMIAEMAKRAESKRKKLIGDKFSAWEAGLTDEARKDIEKVLPISLTVLYRTYGMSNEEVRTWFLNYYLTLAK